MYICYIDESGTADVPGNTSHFVLAGLSIPISSWRDADREITDVLAHYRLEKEELHTAWILRDYPEQTRIPGFETMDSATRRSAVERERVTHLLKLQRAQQNKTYRQQKKNYAHTRAYVHLTLAERKRLIDEIAQRVASWAFARLFAECIDKKHFDPTIMQRDIGEQAFEQVVSRFELYLANLSPDVEHRIFGILVHDNNQTVATKHTEMMRNFHQHGTLWTNIFRIIETPLFVDSKLTRMVQLADLCSYALRRYVENDETALFRTIFQRADSARGVAVGVRHFTRMTCACLICQAHRRPQATR